MPECRRTIPIMDHSSTRRMSLHQCAEEEALKFKWYRSEEAGHDVGEVAIKTWIGHHWNGFLRQRWLDHLEGKTYWIELEERHFGLLPRAYQSSPLINERPPKEPCLTVLYQTMLPSSSWRVIHGRASSMVNFWRDARHSPLVRNWKLPSGGPACIQAWRLRRGKVRRFLISSTNYSRMASPSRRPRS